MNKYQNTTNQPIQTIPVETPNPSEKAYLHTYQAAVGVPLVKAVVYGALVGIAVFVVAWRIDFPDPWLFGLLAALAVTFLRYAGDDFLWLVLAKAEKITGLELDGKPGIGEQKTTNIDLTTKVGQTRRTQRLQIPASEEQILSLGLGIMGGVPFSEGRWTGKGKPFSINEFRELRDYFERAELIQLVNDKAPQQGYEFTETGLSMLQHYVPYPTDGNH